MKFAERLKQLRKDAGVSQIILHLETGLANSLIQSYERGVTLPFEKNAIKLADFFRIDANQLIREIEKERMMKIENSR